MENPIVLFVQLSWIAIQIAWAVLSMVLWLARGLAVLILDGVLRLVHRLQSRGRSPDLIAVDRADAEAIAAYMAGQGKP